MMVSSWASNALCFHYGICPEASAPEAPELIAENSPDLIEGQNNMLDAAAAYKVVPNPTSGEAVLIAIDQSTKTKSLTVYDVNGRQILAQNGTNHHRFDTSGLPNGVYFCRILTLDGSTEMVKFIINR